ncbi:hypothetical protein HispidOSU_002744 [Sigmodon hispidus]
MHSISTRDLKKEGTILPEGSSAKYVDIVCLASDASLLEGKRLFATQLGRPASTMRKPRSTRAANPHKRCHEAQAPPATQPLEAASHRAHGTKGTLLNPAPERLCCGVTPLPPSFLAPPTPARPRRGRNLGQRPGSSPPAGDDSLRAFPRGPVGGSEWRWQRPRPGKKFSGHFAGGRTEEGSNPQGG